MNVTEQVAYFEFRSEESQVLCLPSSDTKSGRGDVGENLKARVDCDVLSKLEIELKSN